MGKEHDTAKVLARWVERDLSAAAAAGELCPAFRVEEQVRRLSELLASGRRPILAGPSGVGKTAILHELLRRVAAGCGPEVLAGKRVVQVSLRARASALPRANQLGAELQKLMNALAASPDIVPFFRDFHVAAGHDLGAQFVQLALRHPGPILLEGEEHAVRVLVGREPDLEAEYFVLPIAEPSPDLLRRIVDDWAASRAGRGIAFEPAALTVACELSNRFLARSHQPRAVLEVLDQVAVTARGPVSERDVVERFIDAFRVPRLLVDPDGPLEVESLADQLRSRVLEQDEAVDAVVRMVARIRAGVADPRRPFGAFLLVGPTGVGKTLIAQALAEELFGSRDHLVRVNLGDYPGPFDDDELFGDPDAHRLADRRGLLTARLQGHNVAVLLLDEFEKAHPNVHDRFLQFIDEGVFINGAGETVSCRSMVVIATSNAGAELYRTGPLGFDVHEGGLALEARRRLLQHFRFELLNRFDEVVLFEPLSRPGVRQIAAREIEALAGRSGLRSRGIALHADPSLLDWLAEQGYDQRFGARYLRRAIERHVATAVARVIVSGAARVGDTILVSVRDGQVHACRAVASVLV